MGMAGSVFKISRLLLMSNNTFILLFRATYLNIKLDENKITVLSCCGTCHTLIKMRRRNRIIV
jgi:hypothetical protein